MGNPESMEKIITKRPAVAEDFEFAKATHHIAYKDTVTAQFGEWNNELQDKFFNDAWHPESSEIISLDESLAGYCQIERTPESIILHELVMSPDFQGQGIGTKIIAEIIQESEEKEIPVRLQVLKQNPAQNLYKKFGFEIENETDTHFEMIFDPNRLKN